MQINNYVNNIPTYARPVSAIIVFLSLFFIGCKEKNNETPRPEFPVDSSVIITRGQTLEKEQDTTDPAFTSSKDTIYCNGYIKTSLSGRAYVSAPARGYVKSISRGKGDWVNKNEILAVLQHPDYLTLQEDYLKAKAQLEYHEEEFARQGELTIENATSIKKMQLSKTSYESILAKYNTSRQKLVMLGMVPEKITSDNILSTINLHSPMSGYVIASDLTAGQYVIPRHKLYEIINNDHYKIFFRIKEELILKIKKGMPAGFSLTGQEETMYYGKITAVGHHVNFETRMVDVEIETEKKVEHFIDGMSLNGWIKVRHGE